MQDNSFEIVRFALALHLDLAPSAIEASDRLRDDFGLDPLDLVLIALRLEDLTNTEFPVADLEYVQTVDDLVVLVRRWTASERRTAPPPPPKRHDSGIVCVQPGLPRAAGAE